MKKCSFVKFIRKHTLLEFEYEVIKDVQINSAFSELPGSLFKYTKIEFIPFDRIDSETNIIITFDVVDVTPMFEKKIQAFVNSLNCKSIFFDFSTYDNQEIDELEFDKITKLITKEHYFISKNLIQNRENHLYFEVLFYHHIREGCEIPNNIQAYKKLKQSQSIFWPKYKGFYYPGHTRFHKVKFLEFLYQNNFLDELIWSCTSPDFDKPIFRDFVPEESDEEFNLFEILKLLPRRIDFNLFSKDVYNSRGGQINLITYLDTNFEFVAETRYYETTGKNGSKKTFKSWNNISEKIIKPTMLSHPFILIAKPNTISLLEKWGLNYRFDFWNYEYDSIENADERFESIKEFSKKVMNMSQIELKEFNNDYYHFSKNNYNIMLNEMYVKSLQNIWNKF